jgi:thiosulfate reductase cytochrome b subunit
MDAPAPLHSAAVRVTHWLNALCFFALLVTGVEILISHPRFYWGETGNSSMPALFSIPIPASRDHVPTGYDFVLPDQNGWSRALHFQAAWLLLFTGFFYVLSGFLSGHFRKDLLPARDGAPRGYNALQRLTYLAVVFGLIPLLIWTGLSMSPAFASVFPSAVAALGGHQSARTLHFFATVSLVLFFFGHIAMVALAGFRTHVRAMITGHPEPIPEQRSNA